MNKERELTNKIKVSLIYLIDSTDHVMRHVKNAKLDFDIEQYYTFYNEMISYFNNSSFKTEMYSLVKEFPDISPEINNYMTNNKVVSIKVLKICVGILFPPYFILLLYKQRRIQKKMIDKLLTIKNTCRKTIQIIA